MYFVDEKLSLNGTVLIVSEWGFSSLELESMPNTDNRVLFQNADETINMGLIFNDPDLEMKDIYWYTTLADEMKAQMMEDPDLITVTHSADRKWTTQSCYVELHRNDALH